MNKCTLDKVKIAQQVCINSITDNNIKVRLMELGLTKNSYITPVFKSPSSDPIAYKVNNILIALRNDEAKHVEVIL